MRNPEAQKTTATNADFLLIMRNSEDQNTTGRNVVLLLIMRNRDEQKTAARNEDLLLSETLKIKKQQQQMQIYLNYAKP